MSEADDVEVYPTTFEQMMTKFEVQKDQWVFKLFLQLTEKVQWAYAVMSSCYSSA